jgi:putative DNA methylase
MGDLFTSRQLVALTTFGAIVAELQKRITSDALSASVPDDQRGLELGGNGATAYAEAIRVYLAFQIDQLANHLSTICAWHVNNEQLKNTFARQSLPMTADFAETNPFSTSTGSLNNLQERQIKAFASLTTKVAGLASQADAAVQTITRDKIISTDPPYYDNIAYADLSDFFYVWTRRNLHDVFPKLLATMQKS